MIGVRSKGSHKTWHKDSSGVKGDDLPKLGQRYYHPKTQQIYVVRGVVFDSQRERWMVRYSPEGAREGVEYVHLPEDFNREGRFMPIADYSGALE